MDSKFFKSCCCVMNVFQSFFLLIVRLYWGYLFFRGAVWKIQHMQTFIEFMNGLHISTPIAYLVTYIELIGGILIFFGFLSRLSGGCLSVIMFGAYITAHTAQWHSFFNNPAYFFSAPAFSFLFASLVILFFGAGLFSIDGIIKQRMIRKMQNKDHDHHQ